MAGIDRSRNGSRILVIVIALILAAAIACALYAHYRSEGSPLPGFDWHIE